MYKYRVILLIPIFGSLLLITQFQNCSSQAPFEAASKSIKVSSEDIGEFNFDHDPTPFKTEPITNFSPPLMDRQMVVAILSGAFGPRWVIESSNIETRGQEFGKGCLPHNDTRAFINGQYPRAPGAEPCALTSGNYNVGLETFASAARSSYLINTCSILTSTPETLEYFIEQLGSEEDVIGFSETAIINAYQLFYVSKPKPSQTVIDSIRLIGQSQADPQKAWSAVAFSLCAPGHWQVL